MFFIILNIVGSLMHFYLAQRIHSLGAVRRRIPARAWWPAVVALWLVYLAGIQLGDAALDWRWWPGQFAFTWLGVLFVTTQYTLLADLLTGFGSGFGFRWKRQAPRVLAVGLVAGFGISAFAIFQAVRAPAITRHELVLPGLPRALDGTVLVAISDTHLGAQRRAAWLGARVDQINALDPAVVVMLGDQVEDEPVNDDQLAPVLRRLRAPLGVWAVTGNHEYYGDAGATIAEFAAGGVRWLRDERVEIAPGLHLAGLDDIGRAMHGGDIFAGLARTIPERAAGATILLAHIPAPALVQRAAQEGVALMLSGHTHAGQIWPFGYLVKRRFPQLVGLHREGAMQLVISRGAGGWGPRMRLWQPGEILKLTLRAPAAAAPAPSPAPSR